MTKSGRRLVISLVAAVLLGAAGGLVLLHRARIHLAYLEMRLRSCEDQRDRLEYIQQVLALRDEHGWVTEITPGVLSETLDLSPGDAIVTRMPLIPTIFIDEPQYDEFAFAFAGVGKILRLRFRLDSGVLTGWSVVPKEALDDSPAAVSPNEPDPWK